MSKQEFAPNGLSFDQIKKYAKRLKKESNLTSQQALNQITQEKTNFSKWEDLVNFNKDKGGSIDKIKQNDKTIIIYGNQPIFLMNYIVGSGAKTFILSKSKKKILYVVASKHIKSHLLKDVQMFGVEDKVVCKTYCEIYKEDIKNEDYDSIVLDEFHMTSINIKALYKCYYFAIQNKIPTYQFYMVGLNEHLFHNTTNDSDYNINIIKNAILNLDDFIFPKTPYELYDYQKESMKILLEKLNRNNQIKL